jgi:hypothetical protein
MTSLAALPVRVSRPAVPTKTVPAIGQPGRARAAGACGGAGGAGAGAAGPLSCSAIAPVSPVGRRPAIRYVSPVVAANVTRLWPARHASSLAATPARSMTLDPV